MLTFPITGIEIRTVEAYDALIFTPQYITSPIDSTVHSDKNFIVTREIAKQLIEMLQNGIHKLESSSPSIPESEKH
ncbi:biofilm formation regulator BssS [Xenorhabdus littoralis]|uniref:biofilm formation regulator BssS n=1 Tax=Xenorhabdus littoralis TaxID=2582835 RepID=UPI0034DFF902